ncbi:phytanoyl-CoA dioxygenase family protein [Anabaena sp. WFMT]|uniref:phytanoyl-CoA dioxygenase family protein n=1 Tax=Anabaena sp. WFMT TaxID=3449730 RepID=UPI003F21CA78
MHLTKEQFATYQDQGFVLLPEYFPRQEVEIMKAEIPALAMKNSPTKVLEGNGSTVRSLHGSHTTNEVFNHLSRHPFIVKPAMQIVGSKVYIYQFKINIKAPFDGDIWKWHQDYIFWHKEDGMPKPQVTNAMLLLDDMNEFNGPLFVIPGSHKEGLIDLTAKNPKATQENANNSSDTPAWLSSFSANLKYTLSQELISDLVSKYGIYSIKAPAGSVLFFNSNIVHASANNISPFGRNTVIITYNSIENIPLPVVNSRPDFLVGKDYRPVEPLTEKYMANTSKF